MRRRSAEAWWTGLALAAVQVCLGAGCPSDPTPVDPGGGDAGTGGHASGGANPTGTGGTASGGTGASASGGTGASASGGTGGGASGGAAAGAPGTGGRATGGVAGSNSGGGAGSATGGSPGGGGAAGVGGPSLCTPGKFLICEDFEATAVGGVPTGWTKHGDATVQADQAARGAHALKVGAAATGERRIYADAAKLGSGHWGRIYYRVQLPAAVPPSGNVIHSTLIAFEGNGPRNGKSEYRVVDTVEDANGKHQFLWNVQPSSVAEFGKGSSYNWMYDGKWHCAEWHVDGPTQSFHFYIDGAEVTQIAIDNGAGNTSGTDIPNAFTEAHVGWNNYQSASPGFVAWIDEVAMHSSRIGCGN